MYSSRLYITTVLILLFTFNVSAKDYNVRDFGIKGDGISVNTASIQYAIDFISGNGGGRLIFKTGTYKTGTIYLKSDVTLHFESGATLLSTANPNDFVKDKDIGWMSMIFAKHQQNIGITGPGVIDGRGFKTATKMLNYIYNGIYTDQLLYDRPREWNRPENIHFRECRNVTIKDITLKDPASWNQTYDQCTNVVVDGIKVDSKSYWNNDGIDIVDCDSVIIRNSYFDAADDVICFKSHDSAKICQNVIVENCTGRSSANGLKFGTVSRGGFRNFTVKNLTFFDTYRSAITFAAVDGAIVENIFVDGVHAVNTGNAIYLRIGERWSKGKQPVMKNITIRNVYAEIPKQKPDAGYNYEGPVEDLPRNISPASIIGLPGHRIENVTLENIEIVYPGGGDSLYAKRGLSPTELNSVPEMPAAYPEFSQFKELPAWGFYLRHADKITFNNVTLRAEKTDYRPAIVLDDIKDAAFNNTNVTVQGEKKEIKEQIFPYQSDKIIIR